VPESSALDETVKDDISNSLLASLDEARPSADFDWAGVAKDDNYIWYLGLDNRRAGKGKTSDSSVEEVVVDPRSPLTILAVLFFVPIFVSEFFFSVSRPFICTGEWAAELCTSAIG
jgi:hypothetical protein